MADILFRMVLGTTLSWLCLTFGHCSSFMSVVVSFSHKDRMECRFSIQFLTLENLFISFSSEGKLF